MSVAHGGQIIAVGSRGRRDSRAAAVADHAARPGQRPAEGPVDARARLPGAAPGPPPGFPGAAFARSDAQQPAAAADVVHRPRARGRQGRGTPQDDAPAHAGGHGRSRQDAAVAADRRRHARRASGRRLVRRSRADPRPVAGRGHAGPGPGRARGAGEAAYADAVRAPQAAEGAADPRQLRARRGGVRGPRQRAAARRAQRPDHRDHPRGAARAGRADLSGAAAGTFPIAPRASKHCRDRKPCSCSWIARSCRSRASR